MPQRDTSELKDRIITFLQIKGPSLPIHISKEIEQNSLFTSAFISELLAEGRLKNSNMKIGSSSLHFIEGQEPRLEKFGEQHLKSREKDAFLRLKQRLFLKDSEQEPPIRVALRTIKDFAVPFTSSKNELIWRYFASKQEDYEKELAKEEPVKEEPVKEPKEEIKEIAKEETKVNEKENEPMPEAIKEEKTPVEEIAEKKKDVQNNPKELDIFDKSQENLEAEEEENQKVEEEEKEETGGKEKPTLKNKTAKKKKSSKANQKFFEKIKNYILSKNWEILDLIGFSKTDISLKIRANEKELLLVGYNKKRINETEILKAYKKASELNLPYIVLSLGDTTKKLETLLDALKNIDSIQKIE